MGESDNEIRHLKLWIRNKFIFRINGVKPAAKTGITLLLFDIDLHQTSSKLAAAM